MYFYDDGGIIGMIGLWGGWVIIETNRSLDLCPLPFSLLLN